MQERPWAPREQINLCIVVINPVSNRKAPASSVAALHLNADDSRHALRPLGLTHHLRFFLMTLRGTTILFFILWWRSTQFYFGPYRLCPRQTTDALMTWKRPYLALGCPNCPHSSNGNESKLTLWAIFCYFHISHILFNDHIVEKWLSDGRNFINNSMFIPRSQLLMTKTPALEQSRTGHFILYV